MMKKSLIALLVLAAAGAACAYERGPPLTVRFAVVAPTSTPLAVGDKIVNEGIGVADVSPISLRTVTRNLIGTGVDPAPLPPGTAKKPRLLAANQTAPPQVDTT